MIVSQPDRVLLRAQVHQLGGALGGRLLDIGAGSHRRYQDAVRADEYLTLDANDAFHPDIVGSAEQIPLPDASLDSILCTQVLEHVPHPVQMMQEMFRILRPGGKALLTAPQWNELHEEPHDYFRFTIHGMRTLAEDAGFSIMTILQRGKYHSCLAQQRIRWWIDFFHPYERRWIMPFLAIISRFYTSYAIWRDAHDRRDATRRHAIGWSLLLEKPPTSPSV